MTARRKTYKYIIISIGTLFILGLAVIGWYLLNNAEDDTAITSISRAEIQLNQDTVSTSIDFDKCAVYIATMQNGAEGNEITDSKTIYINQAKLNEYREYLLYYQNTINKKAFSNSKQKDDGVKPYWKISLVDGIGQLLEMQGTDAYPEDWNTFIEKTNSLVGEEYLTSSTHGLAMK